MLTYIALPPTQAMYSMFLNYTPSRDNPREKVMRMTRNNIRGPVKVPCGTQTPSSFPIIRMQLKKLQVDRFSSPVGSLVSSNLTTKVIAVISAGEKRNTEEEKNIIYSLYPHFLIEICMIRHYLKDISIKGKDW